MTQLQAHGGVSSDYPENTMAAFRAAVEQGYNYIEFDPKYTSDGEIVILHDNTLNRTARRTADGSSLEKQTEINKLTLSEAQSFEYGSWFDGCFKGERLPLLTDLLDLAVKTGIPLKMDNVWERFPENIKEKMFKILSQYEDSINFGFTCSCPETVEIAAERFPKAVIHYDGGDLSEERLREVSRLAEGHTLYIWVCFDNALTSWFKGTKASSEVCDLARKYGKLGIWILSKREDFEKVMRDICPDIIETTGHVKPEWLSQTVKAM